MNKPNLKEVVIEQEITFPALPQKKKKVYCVYGYSSDANWISPLGFTPTQNLEDCDVAVFGGGKDIDPGWYGEKRGSNTSIPAERDRKEKQIFEKIQEMRKGGADILSVGLCRGGQLCVALSGGQLIQDVSNHFGSHSIATFDKKEFMTNSIHHQMFYPYNMDRKEYKILAWSKKNISGRYLDGHDRVKWVPEGFKEIEVLYLPKTHSLAIQGHPEMMFNYREDEYTKTIEWMQKIFLDLYNKKDG